MKVRKSENWFEVTGKLEFLDNWNPILQNKHRGHKFIFLNAIFKMYCQHIYAQLEYLRSYLSSWKWAYDLKQPIRILNVELRVKSVNYAESILSMIGASLSNSLWPQTHDHTWDWITFKSLALQEMAEVNLSRTTKLASKITLDQT